MPPSKIRFVTACQQLLALGVVLAALTPAASVLSLDVVRETPSGGVASVTTPSTSASLSAYTRETARASKVPTQVVDPTVREVPLTAATGATARQRTSVAANTEAPATAARVAPGKGSEGSKAALVRSGGMLTSTPQTVTGYGSVGVTWEHGVSIAEDDITIQVRTRTGSSWSDWIDVDYDPEHAPDPGSAEARHARPGTDALLVGDVDDVQVQATTADGSLPPDMKLAVIDPGHAARTAEEKPALDTSTMDGTRGDATAAASAAADAAATPTTIATDAGEGTDGSDQIDLQAAMFTPKPKIYSRAQWGADESMRQKSSLHYYEVHAGFVHHTVNANNYTRAEVPGILRSIYAYHTQSRGWSDIGYNFLVDRFGRIWEGRYGGVDRPVVGAHTLNYNDYSFAMSAIGNYDIKQPSQAMVQAYGALFAWKLSLHGVNASSTKQWVGSRYFEAINGHRDAASTACPGKYLYAKIPQIRKLAAATQKGWSGRELESDVAGAAYPDIVARRTSDDQLVTIPTGGLTAFASATTAATDLPADAGAILSPDLTGDGVADLVVTGADGAVQVRPGSAAGTFGAPSRTIKAAAGHDLLTAAGDLNGDGRSDLVARVPATGRLDAFLGRKGGSFKVRHLGTGWGGYDLLVGAGDVDGDGHPDLIARDADGAMWLHRGAGSGSFKARTTLAGSWSAYTALRGYGDFTGDGHDDLVARDSSGKGWVLPSKGDGTYGHALGPLKAFTKKGSMLGAAQVVDDETPDVVFRKGSTVRLLPNRGTTELRAPIASGTFIPGANLVLNAGDWDRDGHSDVITRTKKDGSLMLRRGDGEGHFAAPVKIGTGFGKVRLLAAVGDMTGDGYPDLMGQPKGGSMRIYPGSGLSGLKASYVAHSAITAGRQVAVGRWNGDGAPDSLFRNGSKLTLYPGNGPGGLTSPKALGLNLTPYDWVIGISDIQRDGHADLIVRDKATGALWLVPGTASGFGKRRYLGGGMGGYDLAG
ncbi:FG-GAP-like repeat-containing protein [Nocardioides mangrovi]|uniref:FG-GAP-like repeat-containing protein n=1 Tax=Nocardioides mangrovi TaxID=2874580 RepID=A0ABS7U8N4_9ACTN|nr:FG-GAP-like repeat-containing protein [Nocardioides mangrovi]MBZ5737343.1 FG-GAP-like repeat-containing protein [Nocardioides mangrovi]